MTFRIGQKVVCINDEPNPGTIWFDGEAVRGGNIYTVSRAFCRRGVPTLWLKEVARVDRSLALHGPDCGYRASRFRPVVERKTDISIFTDMLKRVPEDVHS